MNKPKVSVIVPNYNHARFLRQRLDSVIGQTYKDIELIILDDASTDASREIIEEYASRPRTRVIYNRRNSGSPFKQWHQGLSCANGEYAWIAESDDFAEPEFLSTLVAILDRNPEVGVAYCRIWLVNELGQRQKSLGTWSDPQGRWEHDFVASGLDEMRRYPVAGTNIPNASAVLFRLTAAREAGSAYTKYRCAGDWRFWVDLMSLSSVAYCCTPMSCFRWHKGNVTETSQRSGLALIESLHILRRVKLVTGLSPEVISGFSSEWKIWQHRRSNMTPLTNLCIAWQFLLLDPGFLIRGGV